MSSVAPTTSMHCWRSTLLPTTAISIVPFLTPTIITAFDVAQVKEVEWDEQCGANNLDALLAQHFSTDFAAKNKLKVADVMGNPRTMAKMRKQVGCM